MVRKSCADVVHDAVVLGIGRPSACLAVEAKTADLDEPGKLRLAQTVVERLAPTSGRLFPHERIEDPKKVLVVEQGTFIRTQVGVSLCMRSELLCLRRRRRLAAKRKC